MNRKLIITFFVLWCSAFLYTNIFRHLPLILGASSLVTIPLDILFLVGFCWCYLWKVGSSSIILSRKDVLPIIKSGGLFALLFIITAPFGFSALKSIFYGEFTFAFEIISQGQLVSLFQESYLSLISSLLIAPITEETVNRGLLQEYLIRKKYSIWIVILVPAAIFTILHFKLTNIHILFACGILYGYIYYKYRKISINIICHSLWNILCTLFISDIRADFGFWIVYVLALVTLYMMLNSVRREVYIADNYLKPQCGNMQETQNSEITNENT